MKSIFALWGLWVHSNKSIKATTQVIKSETLSIGLTGFGVEVCTIVRVEEDVACQCKCETQPSECHPTQIYSPTSCQCLCENHLDKARCIQQASLLRSKKHHFINALVQTI